MKYLLILISLLIPCVSLCQNKNHLKYKDREIIFKDKLIELYRIWRNADAVTYLKYGNTATEVYRCDDSICEYNESYIHSFNGDRVIKSKYYLFGNYICLCFSAPSYRINPPTYYSLYFVYKLSNSKLTLISTPSVKGISPLFIDSASKCIVECEGSFYGDDSLSHKFIFTSTKIGTNKQRKKATYIPMSDLNNFEFCCSNEEKVAKKVMNIINSK